MLQHAHGAGVCPHCRAPMASSGGLRVADKALTSKSTETQAQEQRMLAALRAGPKTTDDFRQLGIYQVSARIFGLRKQGAEIRTDLFNGISADGYSHARMARYTLVSEPLFSQGEEAACTN